MRVGSLNTSMNNNANLPPAGGQSKGNVENLLSTSGGAVNLPYPGPNNIANSAQKQSGYRTNRNP